VLLPATLTASQLGDGGTALAGGKALGKATCKARVASLEAVSPSFATLALLQSWEGWEKQLEQAEAASASANPTALLGWGGGDTAVTVTVTPRCPP
jgi:hypothetical protein